MNYGKFIQPRAFAKAGTYIRDPQNAVEGGDMSGYGGMNQTRGVDLECVWLSARDVNKDVYIAFDFGSVVRLGYMCVWNMNQTDGFGAGVKKAKIYYGYDGEEYFEFKGKGYPFVFAPAFGKPGLKATNLDDRKHSPVDFGGLSARYIKIVPDIESGEGCHGKYIEGQTRYGLSQVRFFRYLSEPEKGGELYACAKTPEEDVLTSGYGLDENGMQGIDGASMYMTKANPDTMDMIFDLDMCVHVQGIDFINYNVPYFLNAGLKKFYLSYSLNGFDWKNIGDEPFELSKGTGKPLKISPLADGSLLRFPAVYARYFRITAAGGAGIGSHGCVNGFEFRYGLSKVKFIAADGGFYTRPARDWTELFSSYNGWTGSDGIFIVGLDGNEAKRDEKDLSSVKSVVTFGDTFIGNVNPVTWSRKRADFVNNSLAYLDGADPDTLSVRFVWGDGAKNGEGNLIRCHSKEYSYWLQDCFVANGKFYAFTDNVKSDADNPDLPEGFRFHLVGVDMVIFDIKNGELDYTSQKNIPTPLFTQGKKNLMYGCAVFANTKEAGAKDPDGYVYVYGIMDIAPGVRNLVVSRTLPENIDKFGEYTFFDGENWSKNILDSAPIADDLSSEMSVMPVDFGKDEGKYAFIYSASGVSDYVMKRVADHPWGPFTEKQTIYSMHCIDDLVPNGLKKVYQYNAKAHFNVAKKDEMLISYNVNCMDYESHLKNGNVYRPRFLQYKEF